MFQANRVSWLIFSLLTVALSVNHVDCCLLIYSLSFIGVCTQGTAPSVSSINRILRNRAAERAAAEFARNYQLAAAATAASVHYPITPQHPTVPHYPGKCNRMVKHLS